MKRLHSLAAFTLLLPLLCASGIHAALEKSGDMAVVTVGTKSIKRSQVDSIVELMSKAQSAYGEITPARREEIKKLVTTNLIGQELLELEAKAKHVEATPMEVDSVLQGFKKRFPDEATFKKMLKEAGDNEARVKTKLARQIRADKVLAARIKRPEMPSEKEMKEFWDSHKKDFPVNDSLRALQIVMLTDDKTSKDLAERKRTTLETIRNELLRDSAKTPVLLQRFMAAAAQVSEGPEGKSGGDLQRFNPRDFNPEFRKQAQALQVGQMSPVFKTPLGFHLILLIEKYDGKFASYQLQVTQNLVNQKTAIAGGEMRQFLRSLAAKYPVKFLTPGYKDSSEGGIY